MTVSWGQLEGEVAIRQKNLMKTLPFIICLSLSFPKLLHGKGEGEIDMNQTRRKIIS